MLSKIWERYFLKETLKTFFLFLVCFYGLYVIVDYAGHTSSLPQHKTHVQWQELGEYYIFIFLSRAEILIPFALLIATIKTLTQLNTRNELVALMAGGIPLHSILRPFVILGLLFTCLLFLNEELLLPHVMSKLRYIEDASKSEKRASQAIGAVKNVILEDGSPVLYQSFDSAKQMFFDVYWINSLDDVYRMKYLEPYKDVPVGYYVDHLIRNNKDELIQKESFDTKNFPAMRFNPTKLHENLTPAEDFSITTLYKKLPTKDTEYTERESQILAAFHWKLALPWLCLLAVIAPAPFCVRFSRTLPIFFIYVAGIFGLIAFYLMIDASLVLARRQVISAIWAVWGPFLMVSGIFVLRFLQMR